MSRPTVVIAGWLGCQPSKLRRYQVLYHQRGYPTLIRIATPLMVVTSVAPSSVPKPPLDWPRRHSSSASSLKSMEDLAWDVLQQLYNDQSYRFLMHSFSNGGCFLYEKIRRILKHYQTLPNPPSSSPESIVPILRRFQLVAGVFDSCPALDLSRIDLALSHCTEDELEELRRQHPRFRSSLDRHLVHRQEEYRSFLQRDDDPLPQLFVYSRDDPLVPFDELDALVEARRRRPPCATSGSPGGRPGTSSYIQKLVLDRSPHCAHLLHHPKAYTEAIDSFLRQAVQCDASTTSKL